MTIDADFPAPTGIGDTIVGIKEGTPVHVNGSFDSIVDGLVFSGQLIAHFNGECTRCLKEIDKDWPVSTTVFFPYESASQDAHGKSKEDVEIIAGEEESEDSYPLPENGAFANIEAMLRDTLVESLPLQPLCKPDCEGLCPQCGVDLNDDPDHHHDATDIRFAGLEGLKAQLEAQQGE
jgi:uncharacterized protein